MKYFYSAKVPLIQTKSNVINLSTLIQTTTWPLEGLETPSGQGNGKPILASYTTLNYVSKNEKVPTTAVSNTRLSWVGYVLDTLD